MMDADETNEADRTDGTDATNESGPEAVREAIMEATYRALCERGAANLTVQAIADEFEKSKSLIFYHYDSKEDVLSSFLEYLLNRFEERVATMDTDDPTEQLDALIDGLLFGPDDHEAFQTAMLELRSQAPYKEAYREQFRTNDAHTRDVFESVIERGIERGEFADVDPARTAMTLFATIDGARTRWILLGDDEVLETVREGIDEQLEQLLFVGDSGAE